MSFKLRLLLWQSKIIPGCHDNWLNLDNDPGLAEENKTM